MIEGDVYQKIIDVPLVMRKARKTSQEVREQYGIDKVSESVRLLPFSFVFVAS